MFEVEKCKHPGCTRFPYYGPESVGPLETLCWNHFRKARKELETPSDPNKYTVQCSFGKGKPNQCLNPARAGGLCTKHYQRGRRTQRAEERREDDA
jgi:hypothetical protein